VRTAKALVAAFLTAAACAAAAQMRSVSFSPDTGTGATQTFTATFSDQSGVSDFRRVAVLLNTQAAAAHACYVYYYPQRRQLYLQNDTNTAPLGPLQGLPVSNSQCAVTNYSVGATGDNLILTVTVAFQPTWHEDLNVYLDAENQKAETPWATMGVWSTYGHACSDPPQYEGSTDYYLTSWNTCSIDELFQPPRIQFDANGIPMVLEYGGYRYNPDTVAQYGLRWWGCYKASGSPQSLAKVLKMANWLVGIQDPASGKFPYTWNFNGGALGVLNAPWASAITQGQSISLLLRAYHATGDGVYLTAAENATKPLTKSVADGGLVDTFQGHPVYEEYPTTPPTFVLNGFMFTLIGLYDLAPFYSPAQQLYDRGMKTLDFILPYYDLGDLSSYNLGRLTEPPSVIVRPADYHAVHVEELRVLETIGLPGDKIVPFYSSLWCNYKPPL